VRRIFRLENRAKIAVRDFLDQPAAADALADEGIRSCRRFL
jgi:hypothetical protein